MRLIVLLLCAFTTTAFAGEENFRTSWDGALYGYTNNTRLRTDSLLNPNNQVLRLPHRSDIAELRLNFKAENDKTRISARGITSQDGEGYLSQWQVRQKITEGWNVAAGREVFNWGAGQFRSPSSPFYFDNGRNNPLRELIGIDTVKLTWTPDNKSSTTLAHIIHSGHDTIQSDIWHDSWLLKFDLYGDDWASGIVSVKAQDMPAFYGANGQIILSDALMLYGEVSSSVQTDRETTLLIGAAYTFERGSSLATEYLHEGHGDTARLSSMSPRLLGRDYIHLVWQTNLMNELNYWRVTYTHNITDSGNQFSAYGETTLNTHLIIYALAVLPIGNADQEFSALFTQSVVAGIKIPFP